MQVEQRLGAVDDRSQLAGACEVVAPARDTARAIASSATAAAREEAAEAALVAQGMGEVRLTRAGHAAFAAAAASVRASRGLAIGADLVAAAERAVAEARGQGPAAASEAAALPGAAPAPAPAR